MLRSRFYRVSPSPWPFIVSGCILNMAIGLVTWMWGDELGLIFISFGAFLLVCCLTMWWRDLLREGDQGYHTKRVIKNFRDGIAMFIASEVMFFFSFFFAFFSRSLRPAIEVGGTWPPVGIRVPNAFGVPAVNTLLLLTSGGFVNYALGRVRCRDYDRWRLGGILIASLLGVFFMALQYREYYFNSFCIADGIYGRTFYILTGFHGAHVFFGTLFLVVTSIRLWYGHFLSDRHFGLEACAWYWHFVDVVWIAVYFFVYIWGGGQLFDLWVDYWEHNSI